MVYRVGQFKPKGVSHVDEKKSFGEYIRKKRQEAGMTQRELAQRLYVAESTVSKWERGLSYPDVSLIPEVCRALSISEHEFFTACDDDKAHLQEKQARLWRGLTKGWQWFFGVSYLIAILACFICNIAIFKRLDWFWIVLASLMLAFCFTNLPMLVRRERLAVCLGAATGCLLLLLMVCWLYTGGPWVLGGLAVTAACLALPWGIWAVWRFHGRHVAVWSMVWFTLWLFVLLTVIWLFAGGSWLTGLAFPIAGTCLALLWLYFAVGRWLPVNGWIKGGIYTALTAFLLPLGTALGDWLSGGAADPKPGLYFQWGRLFDPVGYEWINILAFACLLLAAAILLVVGVMRAVCKRYLH